jgi:hypothetical protein
VIEYIKIIDMKLGSSSEDVKSQWKVGDLSTYGFLKMENYTVSNKHIQLLFRDKNKEFTFTCNYNFIEDSLFNIVLTNVLNFDEAKKYVRFIKDKYNVPIDEDDWEFKSFDKVIENENGTIEVLFDISPIKDKYKLSFSVSNIRMSKELSIQDYSTQNDTMIEFFDISWESSKESVIKKMNSFKDVKLDSIYDYYERVDFVGGEFEGVKVNKWVFTFDEDRFYNLFIEFDSNEGSNDFSKLENFLISMYGSERNYHIVYEGKREVYMKDLYWFYYEDIEQTFYDTPQNLIVKIFFRGCCDEYNPKPKYISYTYMPLSNEGLPKRPPPITCPPVKRK